MTYLIAVVSDRIQAENAYTVLEKANFTRKQIMIVGTGYKSPDDLGLVDSKLQGMKRAKFMAYWLVPFGFIAGYGFDLITGLNTFAWAGEPGNHIVGGLLGAMGGAMGSFFVGGGVGLSFSNKDDVPYRKLLNQGKYLVVVEGSENLKDQATKILKTLRPENLQSYVTPDSYYE
jgi:hypothetical protein